MAALLDSYVLDAEDIDSVVERVYTQLVDTLLEGGVVMDSICVHEDRHLGLWDCACLMRKPHTMVTASGFTAEELVDA